MRFCFPTTFYPPYSFGGDAVSVQLLARALVRRGHEVTVVHDVDAFRTLTRGAEPAAAPDVDGVHVVGLRSRFATPGPLLTQQTGRPALRARRLQQILRPGAFDVIHFHNTSLVGGPGLFSYGGRTAKLYSAHEHWLVCPTHVLWRHKRAPCPRRECFRCQLRYRRLPQWWRWTRLMESQLGHINIFVAMSDFSRGKHYEFGFPREMDVLPCFLPDDREAASGDFSDGAEHTRPYFLFVGRLEEMKGLQTLLPVFSSYDSADLIIAGEGTYAPTLRSLAAGLSRVHFLGNVPQQRLPRLYRSAVATIVPSLTYETFGITLIESMQHGTPVIARRLGPFPELVESSGAGRLYSTDQELFGAMKELQHDGRARSQCATLGREAFRARWSESVVLPRYLELVDRARSGYVSPVRPRA